MTKKLWPKLTFFSIN